MRRTSISTGFTSSSFRSKLGFDCDLILHSTEDIGTLRDKCGQVSLHIVCESRLLLCSLQEDILLLLPLGIQQQDTKMLAHILGIDQLASDRASLHPCRYRRGLALSLVVPLDDDRSCIVVQDGNLIRLVHHVFLRLFFLLFFDSFLCLLRRLLLCFLRLWCRWLPIHLVVLFLRLLLFLCFFHLNLHGLILLDNCRLSGGIQRLNLNRTEYTCTGVQRRGEWQRIILSGELDALHWDEIVPINGLHLFSLFLFLRLLVLGFARLFTLPLIAVDRRIQNRPTFLRASLQAVHVIF
mmetsp:Transcript_58456/g.128143  ORF Transcript_58456/g.128143 Transcript_58456/m.128143 type:complete len:295 (+) Transcript_58456:687-1571(+)